MSMFNKLKSFSEDVAKSLNDIQQGDPIRRNAETIKQLKNGSAILGTETPDLGELTQPEDDKPASATAGTGEKAPDGKQLANSEGGESQQPIATSGPLKDIDMDQLPKLVKAKLRKFAKYEDKYPVLLDAYKTEKKKSELILAFEKVLRECTPVSSIADTGLLLDFLKGLQDKAHLLEGELRRSVAEANKLTGERAELVKKLADSEKTVKYAEENVGKLARLEEILKLENLELNGRILALESEVDTNKQKVVELEQRLKEAEDTSAKESAGAEGIAEVEDVEGSEKETEAFEEGAEDHGKDWKLTKELEAAKIDLLAAKSELETSKNDLESIRAEFQTTKSELETTRSGWESTKDDWQKTQHSLQEKEQNLEDLQKKLEHSEKQEAVISALREDLEKAQDATDKAEGAKEEILTELENAQSELLELQKLRSELEVLKGSKNDSVSNAEYNLLKEKVQSLEAESASQSEQIEKLTGERDSLQAQLEKQSKQIEELTSKASDLASIIEEKEREIARLSAQKAISAQQNDTTQDEKELQNGLQVENESDVHEQENDKVEEPSTTTANEWMSKYEAVGDELDRITKERDSLSKELSNCKRQVVSKEEEIEHLRDLLRDLGDDLVTAKDDLKSIREKASAEVAEKISAMEAKEQELIEEAKQKKEKLKSVEILLKEAQEELTTAKKSLAASIEEAKKNADEAQKNAEEATKNAEEAKRNAEEAKKTGELSTQLKSTQEKLNLTQEGLLASQKEAAKHEVFVTEIKLQNTKLEEELKMATKAVASLKAEKQKLNERVSELTKFKSADSSLKLEIASLQSSISHKDEQIRELKDSIEKKNKERDELNNTISSLKTSNSDLVNSNRGLVAEKADLINKQEITFERTNSLNAELSKLQVSRQKVASELDALKLKYDALSKTRASSSDEIQSLRQQYEELNLKARDAQMRFENLEDELSESKNLLQERTRESSTLRRLLIDAEEQTNIKTSELRNELRTINEEKHELESNFLASMKKRQREIDELKAVGDGYLVKVRELENKCEELKKQYEPSKNSASAELQEREKALENTIEELRTSLQASSKKVQDYENTNRILKKLNDELTLKFERLSKNYKHITQQYRQMQSQNTAIAQSASPSARSSIEEKRPDETNVAYLKNVLMGFVEHREQRGQLLPVVKTLFHFDEDEERKLLSALK